MTLALQGLVPLHEIRPDRSDDCHIVTVADGKTYINAAYYDFPSKTFYDGNHEAATPYLDGYITHWTFHSPAVA